MADPILKLNRLGPKPDVKAIGWAVKVALQQHHTYQAYKEGNLQIAPNEQLAELSTYFQFLSDDISKTENTATIKSDIKGDLSAEPMPGPLEAKITLSGSDTIASIFTSCLTLLERGHVIKLDAQSLEACATAAMLAELFAKFAPSWVIVSVAAQGYAPAERCPMDLLEVLPNLPGLQLTLQENDSSPVEIDHRKGYHKIRKHVLKFSDNISRQLHISRSSVPVSIRRNGQSTKPILDGKFILWGHPRSRSTAFERAFIERGDTTVLHEPLSKYAYFGADIRQVVSCLSSDESLLTDPYLADVRTKSDHPRYVFIKDFPYHAIAQLPDSFLLQYQHVVMIRDPKSALLSLERVQPGFKDEEIGYLELLVLIKRLTSGLNLPVHIIKSEEFGRQPNQCLNGCCSFLGIDYFERMVRWSHRKDIPAWNLWRGFHDVAISTDTISEISTANAEDNLSESRSDLLQYLMQIYENILSHGTGASYNPN